MEMCGRRSFTEAASATAAVQRQAMTRERVRAVVVAKGVSSRHLAPGFCRGGGGARRGEGTEEVGLVSD